MKSSKTRNFVVGGVAALVILAGGGAYAVASSSDGSGEKEKMLTTAEVGKAQTAATAEVKGRAVDVESTEDHGGGYEVEVLRNDGSSVDVYLTESFQVAGVEADKSEGKDDKEVMLTPAEVDKAEAAATREVNGRVVSVESEEDYGGGYEVEILKNDGSSVEVYLNKSFEVAGVEADHGEGKDGKDYEDGEYGAGSKESGSKMNQGKAKQ